VGVQNVSFSSAGVKERGRGREERYCSSSPSLKHRGDEKRRKRRRGGGGEKKTEGESPVSRRCDTIIYPAALAQ